MIRRYVCLAAVAATVLVHFPRVARAATIPVRTSAQLQAALESAQDGDVIEIRRGTYRAANADGNGGGFRLADRSNITLRALGKVKIDGGGEVACLTVEDVSGFTVEGIAFQNAGGDGIFMSGVTNFAARRCSFKNCTDSGIDDRGTSVYLVEKCKVLNCAYGIAAGYGGESSEVTIRDSSFKSCSDYGIDVWASGTMMESNSFKDCDVGVLLREERYSSVVRSNRFTGGSSAVISDGTSNTIQFNEISKPSVNGIDLVGYGGHECIGNEVSKAGQYSYWVTSVGNSIRENVARSSGELGLASTQPQANNTYVDNDFDSDEYSLPQ